MSKRKLLGSEKYSTDVMREDEVVLFVEAALPENDNDIAEAVADMRMVDAMLQMQRLHKAVHVYVRKTGTGYTRKGMGFHDSLSRILDGRIEGAFSGF
jgi:hypothetical protein